MSKFPFLVALSAPLVHLPIVRVAMLLVGFVLGGVALVVFDCYALNNATIEVGLVLVLTALKISFLLLALLHWIQQMAFSVHHRDYMTGFLILEVLLIIFSFGIDYYCLYQIDPTSFHLPVADQCSGSQGLAFLYFSLGKYTTAGVGDIHPTSPAARVCAMSEMIVAYFTTVLIIANVGYLQGLFSPKSE